jgi:hypothetical protein
MRKCFLPSAKAVLIWLTKNILFVVSQVLYREFAFWTLAKKYFVVSPTFGSRQKSKLMAKSWFPVVPVV